MKKVISLSFISMLLLVLSFGLMFGMIREDGNSTFEGELELAGHNCDDCTGAEEDDEITVIIKWNEKSETLKLKNQQRLIGHTALPVFILIYWNIN